VSVYIFGCVVLGSHVSLCVLAAKIINIPVVKQVIIVKVSCAKNRGFMNGEENYAIKEVNLTEEQNIEECNYLRLDML
jgi:hypothetical protein